MNLTAPASKSVIPPNAKIYHLQSSSKEVCFPPLCLSFEGEAQLCNVPGTLSALAHLIENLMLYEFIPDSESLCSSVVTEGSLGL